MKLLVDKKGLNNIIIFFLPYFIIVGVFQLIGYKIANTNINNQNKTLFQHLIIALSGFFGLFLLIYFFSKYIEKLKIADYGLSLKNRLNDVFLGAFIGFVAIILGYFFISFYDSTFEIEFYDFSVLNFFGLLGLCFIIAINEEILLRGFILRNLMYSFNNYLALFFSSLLFSCLHLFNPSFTLLSFLNIFLSGLLIGLPYIYTKNLSYSIVIHISWNFFQSLLGFNVSGIKLYSIVKFNMTIRYLYF